MKASDYLPFKYPIEKGVRKGHLISPKLFTVCLEEVLKNLDCENVGISINGEYLNNLRFADDIVLLSESGEESQKMIEVILSNNT